MKSWEFLSLIDPLLEAIDRDIAAITGFEIKEADTEPFAYFGAYLNRPEGAWLLAWRDDPKKRRWFNRVFMLMSDVQPAFACVYYHYANIFRLERDVMQAVEKHDYRSLLKNGAVIAVGNSQKLDFEYQAYIVAYRRCLEYMAVGLAAYFKETCSSFRDLPKHLKHVRYDQEVADRILQVYASYRDEFRFAVKHSEEFSLRDRISHEKYVSAGVINLTLRGFVLAGGGDELNSPGVAQLTQVMSNRLLLLRSFIREMLHAFVDALRARAS